MKNTHLRNPHRSPANHKTRGNIQQKDKQILYMKYYVHDISTYNNAMFYKVNSNFQRVFTIY